MRQSGEGRLEGQLAGQNIPRLSAAMMTPSLNLMAITDVPVTIGDVVAALGPVVCRYEAS